MRHHNGPGGDDLSWVLNDPFNPFPAIDHCGQTAIKVNGRAILRSYEAKEIPFGSGCQRHGSESFAPNAYGRQLLDQVVSATDGLGVNGCAHVSAKDCDGLVRGDPAAGEIASGIGNRVLQKKRLPLIEGQVEGRAPSASARRYRRCNRDTGSVSVATTPNSLDGAKPVLL